MSELNLVLLGPPGSGKGTQGERLQEDFRLPYYATGNILREAVKEQTELGRTAKEYMDRGDLAPDEIVIGIIVEALGSEEAADGFILDGFPRNVAQAEALDAEIERLGRELSAALLIEVSDEEVVRRLSGRRTCAENGHVFHLEFDPPEERGRLRHRRQRAADPRRRQARGDQAASRQLPRSDRAADLLLRRQGPAAPGRRRPPAGGASATGSGRCSRP